MKLGGKYEKIICCITFICQVSVSAEPYKAKAFPSDK